MPLAVVLALWLTHPHAYSSSDPFQYSHHAWQLTHGVLHARDHDSAFVHRLGVTVPTALVYKIFGVTPETTHLIPLLSALAIVVAVWLALPGTSTRFCGAIVAATSLLLNIHSAVLLPDIIGTAFMTWSLLLLAHRQRSVSRASMIACAVTATSLWFCGVLAKESAVWALAIWFGAGLYDSYRKRGQLLLNFYLPALLAGLLLTAGYLFLSDHLFGDPFARLKVVENLAGHHLWSKGDLQRRLFDDFFVFFAEQFGSLAALAALSLLILPREQRLWAWSAATLVALFWFGSTSFQIYEPLPLLPRMVLPCAPPIFILAGLTLGWLTTQRLHLHSKAGHVTALLLVSLICVPQLFGLRAHRKKDPELRAMKIIKEEVLSQSSRRFLAVTESHRTRNMLPIYFGFEPPSNLSVVSGHQLNDELLTGADAVYLLVNEGRASFSKRAYRTQNYAPELMALGLPALFDSKGVHLYRANPSAISPSILHARFTERVGLTAE